jgi:hypothetical protein
VTASAAVSVLSISSNHHSLTLRHCALIACILPPHHQELQTADLQRRITVAAGKLKQQQNLYEAVRSDRNVYSKALLATQDEIKEMRRRFKVIHMHNLQYHVV